MTKRLSIILCSTIVVYSLTVLLTNFSLIGFWTDILFSICLFIISVRVTFRHQTENKGLKIMLRTIAISFSLIVLYSLNPFMTIFFADTFKLRTFYFIKVDNRLFNVQFKPVGAYSGGYGNFLVTESPLYFPIIEKPIYYERTFENDLSEDTFDGQPVDNREIIRQVIKEQIIPLLSSN